MRFIGAFEDPKLKTSSLEELGEWSQLNGNQYQFRTMSRGILNWYPSTGDSFSKVELSQWSSLSAW